MTGVQPPETPTTSQARRSSAIQPLGAAPADVQRRERPPRPRASTGAAPARSVTPAARAASAAASGSALAAVQQQRLDARPAPASRRRR